MKYVLYLAIFSVFAVGFSSSAFAQIDDPVVVLSTPSGDITIEFFPQEAPNHVVNFLNLTDAGFYDGTIFHRIISGFMIQGGDPLTKSGAADDVARWGSGNPGHTVDAEFSNIKHVRGIVSMARSLDPNSAGSQFFIVHNDSSFLDGKYTVFGRVITPQSFETLDKIAALETVNNDVPSDWEQAKITKAQIISKSQVSDLLELDPPQRLPEDDLTVNPHLIDDSLYRNVKLGIEFTAPAGWILQEPNKTSPDVPDVVAITQGTGAIPSTIAVTIAYANMSLDEHVDERMQTIQPVIDSGNLQILSDEKMSLHGRESFVIDAQGTFESNGQSIDVQFKEVIFLENGKFYTLIHTSSTSDFETNSDKFDDLVRTFKVLSSESADDNGCLIATAAYGSEMSPQVQMLREIRDDIVLQTESGSTFMSGFNQFYYSFSPTIADWQRQNPVFKEAVKITITPLLASLSILNHIDIDSEYDILGAGIGIMMLNVGMYFVAPALVAYRILKR